MKLIDKFNVRKSNNGLHQVWMDDVSYCINNYTEYEVGVFLNDEEIVKLFLNLLEYCRHKRTLKKEIGEVLECYDN